jgi:hypothetical protein
MGLISKAIVIGGGIWAYKHHQDKKRAERGESNHLAAERDAYNQRENPGQGQSQYGGNADYYRDTKSQYGGSNPDYYPRDSKAQLEYRPQQQPNPSYASFDRRTEYASGGKH